MVDAAARELANRTAVVYSDVQQKVGRAISSHQKWLVELHALLPTEQPDRMMTMPASSDADLPTKTECQARFPQWLWGTPAALYTWRPKLPNEIWCPAKWSGSPHNWKVCCDFLRQLQDCSFNELAVLLHARGFQLQFAHEDVTFFDLYKLVREAMQLLNADDTADPHPGEFHTTKPRCCGRVLPQGSILGAIPYVSDDERVLIAQLFQPGAGRTLASWKILLT